MNLKKYFAVNILKASLLCVGMLMYGYSTAQSVIFPQTDQPGAAKASDENGTLILSNDLLTATFVNDNGHIRFGGCKEMGLKPGTELFKITLGDETTVVPASEMTLNSWRIVPLTADPSAAVGSQRVDGQSIVATLSYGDIDFEWKSVLRDGSHYLRTELAMTARNDVAMHNIIPMIYEVSATDAPEVVGNTRGAVVASSAIFAGLETPTGLNSVEDPNSEEAIDKEVSENTDNVKIIQGKWSRHTTLEAGKTWHVSSVVGLIAPDQARRSFLAYSERERAVPWRPFPHYNSWYELNIDRNNSATYDGHMTADDCVAVVEQWKTNLFDRYDTSIKAFVWDDGWDEYGTWSFNKGFPNGFKEPYELSRNYGVGTGAWLGPVGGYGASGDLRRQYWADNGGMQLSNPAYYNVFLNACSDMVDKYDFCFFKLDGISAQFSSVGPGPGYTGEENAEGIIDILSAVRRIRPDMFFNTTVGTWASPFWFHYTDAVWRQEGDHGNIGDQGDDRECWITYRDRLVYQNFVVNSPLCPINTLMTHGVILTEYGDVSKTMDYDGIVRELRCAFACGSGMVELYCDSKLLNNINNGALWGDIAECIKWQEANADVLPDVHWVGGNPWDGSSANVYGWAAWNGDKATLALRNPSTSTNTFTFTLRQVLEIPNYMETPIWFKKSFSNQVDLSGLETGKVIGLDTPISVTLPGSSVYVFDGKHGNEVLK